MTDLLYDPLVTYNNSDQVVGVLASGFTVAPDAKSISITLRPGTKFHNGQPVTADDVKYTLESATSRWAQA